MASGAVDDLPHNNAPRLHPLFDDEDADVVLSSNDSTLFRLPRFSLKKTCGYFRTKFANTSGPTEDTYIIPYPTDTLAHVLLMISGLPTENPTSFKKIEEAIDVMVFLDAQGPQKIFREHVIPKCDDQPIRLYGLGIKLGWADLEQRGAMLTLPINLLSSTDPVIDAQLSELSSAALLKLLRFHQRRKDQFRRKLMRLEPCRNCLKCPTGTWEPIVIRLMEEIEEDCSGAAILGWEIETWEEGKACWGKHCSYGPCTGAYYRAETVGAVRNIVRNLPTNVNAPTPT